MRWNEVTYRKAQKSIYSVRTAEHIRQRIALDMQWDHKCPIAQDHEGPASGPFWDEKTPRMMLQSQIFNVKVLPQPAVDLDQEAIDVLTSALKSGGRLSAFLIWISFD